MKATVVEKNRENVGNNLGKGGIFKYSKKLWVDVGHCLNTTVL